MFLPNIHLFHFVKCNYNPNDLPLDIPTFYFQVLNAWFSLKEEPQNPLDIRRNYIVFNQHIGIGGNYVIEPSLISNEIILIYNFVDKQGKFLDYNQFCQKYGRLLTHFHYISIIDAIPVHWRKMLKTQVFHTNVCSINEQPYCKVGTNTEKNVDRITTRDVYWFLMSKCKTEATCVKSWSDRLQMDTNKKLWESIFTLPPKCINDYKIKDLQIKIIHRFYLCQSIGSKSDKDTSSICYICKEEIANIVHTFYECKQIKQLWNMLAKWIQKNNTGQNIEMNCSSVLLGLIPYTQSNHSMNHCIMYCKYFIHLERQKKTVPTLKNYLNFYKYVLNIEKELFTLRKERNLFEKYFAKMHNTC